MAPKKKKLTQVPKADDSSQEGVIEAMIRAELEQCRSRAAASEEQVDDVKKEGTMPAKLRADIELSRATNAAEGAAEEEEEEEKDDVQAPQPLIRQRTFTKEELMSCSSWCCACPICNAENSMDDKTCSKCKRRGPSCPCAYYITIWRKNTAKTWERAAAVIQREWTKFAVEMAQARTLERIKTEEIEFCKKFPGKPYQDTSSTYFSDLLKRECLAVVRTSYFAECQENDTCFQDRAKIDAKHFYQGKIAVSGWTTAGARFLVIVSYPWLEQFHPDPERFHLKRLARILKEFNSFHERRESGVMLDYCSLWQRTGQVDTRTEFQQEQFREGLKEINTPYGHQEITAIKLTAVPKHVQRTYDDRGWTLFESLLIDGKAPSSQLEKKSATRARCNAATFGNDFDPDHCSGGKDLFFQHCREMRSPPLSIDGFAKALEERGKRAQSRGVSLFTNGKDQPFVIEKYEKAFGELTATERFIFTRLEWGPPEMRDLSDVLKCCGLLVSLDLSANVLADDGMKFLAEALPSLLQLQELNLSDNRIGDAGISALAVKLPKVVTLSSLRLEDNQIGDDGAESLAKYLPKMLELTECFLFSNAIGDKGRKKLEAAKPPKLQYFRT